MDVGSKNAYWPCQENITHILYVIVNSLIRSFTELSTLNDKVRSDLA